MVTSSRLLMYRLELDRNNIQRTANQKIICKSPFVTLMHLFILLNRPMCQLLSNWFSAPTHHSKLPWLVDSGVLQTTFLLFQLGLCKAVPTESIRPRLRGWKRKMRITSLTYFFWVPVGFLIQWVADQQCFFISRAAIHFCNSCWIKSSVFSQWTTCIVVFDLRDKSTGCCPWEVSVSAMGWEGVGFIWAQR